MNHSDERVRKRLEDIEKKEYFEVPEGYFDKLPGVIQSRVAKPEKSGWEKYFFPTLKYALPAIILVIMVVLAVQPQATEETDFTTAFAEFTEEEVFDYLDDYDLSSDELILSAIDLEEIDEFLTDPSYEEEYLMEEDLLYDIDWFDSEENYENI